MSASVFQRHEIKFLLDSRQRAALEAALAGRMAADQYGESTICSLYYDTPDSLLIRRSLEKPKYKEKIRVRSYGAARRDGTVFVELKKKVRGVVYKRRVPMTEREAEAFLTAQSSFPQREGDSWQYRQIGREIQFARDFYHDLEPAMYLAYDRIAYFSPEDPDLRLTLDRRIRWRTEDLDLTVPPSGEPLLRPDLSLLEVKTASAIPLWLIQILNDNQIRQTSFSKYGMAYTITRTHSLEGGTLSA